MDVESVAFGVFMLLIGILFGIVIMTIVFMALFGSFIQCVMEQAKQWMHMWFWMP